MFGDMKPLTDAAFQLFKQEFDIQIEDYRAEIARLERKIRLKKASLALFDKLEKQLAKPPKRYKLPKMSKAMRKAVQTGGVFVPPYPAHRTRAVAN